MDMVTRRFEQTRRAAPPGVDEDELFSLQSLFLYSSLFSSSEHCVAFLEPRHSNFLQVSLPVILIG